MVKSVFTGHGFLMNDDRASGGEKEEADMVGCKHCLALIKKPDWQADGGFCHCCDAPICGPCADRMQTRGCENFLRVLEGALERKYRRDQLSRVLGTGDHA